MNMTTSVSFRGSSRKAHSFTRVQGSGPWARNAGVAIFAAPDAYGWRIIQVVELTGRVHDVRPIWALSAAERYGASAVFISEERDSEKRKYIVSDIEAGLSPVLPSPIETVAMAA